MDVRHDWRALNEVLFPRRGSEAARAPAAASLVVVEDEQAGRIVEGIVSNGRPFRDAGARPVSGNKAELDALAAKYGAEEAVVLQLKAIEGMIADAAGTGTGTNYFQQLELLRSRLGGQTGVLRAGGGRGAIVSRRHFVVDLFSGPLLRLLPRRFNVLIFIDQRTGGAHAETTIDYRAILLSYSGGKLDQFFEPDFSSLHENRLANWQLESRAIGQYLETRYILPCYGLFMNREGWTGCVQAATSGTGKPWHQFVRAYDEGSAAVYPRGLLAKALLAAVRIMVYFSRL